MLIDAEFGNFLLDKQIFNSEGVFNRFYFISRKRWLALKLVEEIYGWQEISLEIF